MDGFVVEVLALVARWLHVITGIAWVGASFYFIWLDNSLDEPPEWKRKMGIKGDLWSFHGGGIYEVAKYQLGPQQMPQRLHWFYWEAYSTWITGMCLLLLVYYFQANAFLLRSDGPFATPALGIAASLAFIASGYIVYDLMLRAGLADRVPVFVVLMVLFLTFLSWLSVQLFSERAAYIHMGIVIGTIMVANVFFGIIPPQREFVRAIESGRELPAEGLRMAKLRSTHNNYFTLPVLFAMISNHYPFLYGHRYNWLILILIMLIVAGARQFFNLRHKGIIKPQILVVAAILFIALMSAIAWDRQKQQERQVSGPVLEEGAALALIDTHCGQCHSQSPTFPGMTAPPLGVVFDSMASITQHADKAREALAAKYMPLGNLKQLSDEERQQLVTWFAQKAKH